MKILVTGICGFMASHLAEELRKEGHDIIGVDDLSGGSLRNIAELKKPYLKVGSFKFYDGDLTDFKAVQRLPKVDVIYHLAAYAAEGQSVFSPSAINDINLRSMNNLLVYAVNNNVKRFIFTSSMAVYGHGILPFNENMLRHPADPYGAGKAYCEEMLEIFHRIHGLEYVIIRPHNVFGERQNTADPYRNVIGIWMNMILQNKRPIIYGDGTQTRAFSYIRNVTPCMVNALTCKPNEIINLGGADSISINLACKTVCAAMNSPLEPLYMPDRPGEVKHAYCTTEKSRELLGYRDQWSFDAGVMKMAEWIRTIGVQRPSYRLPLEIEKNAPKVWRERMI